MREKGENNVEVAKGSVPIRIPIGLRIAVVEELRLDMV